MANDTKLQYIVELLTQGDTRKAIDELNKLNAASGKTSAGMVEIGRQFKAAFAVIAGSALINQSINAFLEQERAVAKLNAALKAMGEFTPQLSVEMQKLAESLSQVSLFADEAILNVIAKLTAAGAKRQDIERLTRAVMDLSTLMDRDLNRATQAFALALQGEVGALKQAGIAIDETKTATEQFNAALDQIEKKAGGQALEATKTLGGGFEQLKKNIGEVKEAIGGVIIEALDPMIERLSRLAQLVANFASQNRSTLAGGLGTASRITSLMTGVGLGGLIPDVIGGAKPAHPMADLGPDALATLQHFFSAGNASSPAAAVAKAAATVTTAGLSKQDDLAMLEQIKRIGEASAKASERRRDAEKELNRELERQAEELLEDILRQEKQITEEEQFQLDVQQLKTNVMLTFASGLSHAIVSAFEEGDKAFEQFARNFLKAVAEMILQMLILRAISAALGGGGGGVPVPGAAAGGQFVRRFAGGGIAEVNSPTVFPNFNVMAGEAGREVMTVLARPRFERLNGVPAQVGMAGGQRLAITSAAALEQRAGGAIDIRVSLSPEVKVELINSSVQGARVMVINELNQDGAISKGVKALST